MIYWPIKVRYAPPPPTADAGPGTRLECYQVLMRPLTLHNVITRQTKSVFKTNPGAGSCSSWCRASKAGWLQTRVMLCCVTVPLCATPEKWKRVRESEERSRKEDDSPPASDGGTGWESGSRSEHLNTLTHAHMHASCTRCTGLYLDDKWRYKRIHHTARLLCCLAGAWRQYILNLPKIKLSRNQRVSIPDSHYLASASSLLRMSLTFSLSLPPCL